MIIWTQAIKQITNKILSSLDTSEHSILTDTLEIVSDGNMLYFNVTNKEYYVRIGIELSSKCEFHATVNASMFLKLISQITTDTVELTVTDKSLEVEGNGRFKIPLMLAFDKLLELPELTIDNVVHDFTISKDVLFSINNYNTREITGNAVSDIIRKSYYIDDKGCITFTTGACVNHFTLPDKIKLILGPTIVKLFKLFNDDDVRFEMGFNQIGDNMQTRIKLSDSSVEVSAITYSSDGLITKFPVEAIRARADKVYPFSTTVNRNEFAQSLNRFEIFSNYDTNTSECKFTFLDSNLVIENSTGDTESIKLETPIGDTYSAVLDLYALKNIVNYSKDTTINVNFGDHEAFVFVKGDISNIIPECDTEE